MGTLGSLEDLEHCSLSFGGLLRTATGATQLVAMKAERAVRCACRSGLGVNCRTPTRVAVAELTRNRRNTFTLDDVLFTRL